MTKIVTQEGIRLRDENMAIKKTRMNSLIAQLRTTSRVEPASGASASSDLGASASPNLGTTVYANPQRGPAYDSTVFLPSPQPINPEDMWAPLRGVSPRVIAPPNPFLTYTLKIWPQRLWSSRTSHCGPRSYDVSSEPYCNRLYHVHGQPTGMEI